MEPAADAHVPAWQSVHMSTVVAPSVADHVPDGQIVHAAEEVLPVKPLYVPCSHEEHW